MGTERQFRFTRGGRRRGSGVGSRTARGGWRSAQRGVIVRGAARTFDGGFQARFVVDVCLVGTARGARLVPPDRLQRRHLRLELVVLLLVELVVAAARASLLVVAEILLVVILIVREVLLLDGCSALACHRALRDVM